MLPFERKISGRRILITGHTGFTGSWLALWLKQLGVEVVGLALAPNTTPSLYTEAKLGSVVSGFVGDISDLSFVRSTVEANQPDAIIHLAAQPLVRASYREPVGTFLTNTMGTAHLLEAARHVKSVKAVVCITTDKVYQNKEWPWPYRENDALGGKDPYSASKAAAEMIIDSYRASFGSLTGEGLSIATARGGNIIGGGDWSDERLIPDFVRAVTQNQKLTLRYPNAIRPWQHVLALVQGYLMLMAGLLESPEKYARAWNLGPQDPKQHTVREVIEMLSASWSPPPLEYLNNTLPEAHSLALDSSLARNSLNWIPAWSTEKSVTETASWYRQYYANPANARILMERQLNEWRGALHAK
jgi:CDP-glucose 4,6-dehydratase